MNKSSLEKFIRFLARKKYRVYNWFADGNNITEYPRFKEVLYPSQEEIIAYQGAQQKELSNFPKQALLGITILDLKALNLWYQVFRHDVYFQKKIQQSLIVGHFAKQPPLDKAWEMNFEEDWLEHLHFDIFFLEKKGQYKIFTGSEKGQGILEAFGYKNYEHVDFVGPVKESGLDPQLLSIKQKLKNRYIKEIWEKVGAQCLECGKCTYVCPTCFCFDLCTHPALKSGAGKVCREWGSCLFPHFSEVAGGHKFQKTTAERLFFWYYHKFVRIPEEFNQPGCVSCGRCVKACPVGIDLRKVILEIIKS